MLAGNINIEMLENLKGLTDIVDVSGALETDKEKDTSAFTDRMQLQKEAIVKHKEKLLNQHKLRLKKEFLAKKRQKEINKDKVEEDKKDKNEE